MTTDQVRELERRMRARGLSRKASRDAVACVREWWAEQPDHETDIDVELVDAAANVLRLVVSAASQSETGASLTSPEPRRDTK